jgi:cytochrome o ubiquinol oxidase operon protein cyoD
MSNDHAKHHGGAAHGSVKEYLIGLILSIVLTAIPFAIVMNDLMAGAPAVLVILICCVAQVLVQLVFFLHMNTSSEQLWNTTTGIFVVVLVAILIVGTIWIMLHLNHNMLMGH